MRAYHRNSGEYEDLLQEARIAFLEHMRGMDSEKDIMLCKYEIFRAMRARCVEMAPVRIPRNRYKAEIGCFLTVPLEEIDALPYAETFEKSIDDEISAKCFLDQLTWEERRVVDLKLLGYNGHEISRLTHCGSESKVSRLLSSVRKRYDRYASMEAVGYA